MFKKILLVSLVLFTVTLISSYNTRPTSSNQKALIKTIIIDAGHGGEDNGAKGDYSFEKDICLDIAMKLGKKMEQEFPDIKNLYTRTTDVYPAIKSAFALNSGSLISGAYSVESYISSETTSETTNFSFSSVRSAAV